MVTAAAPRLAVNPAPHLPAPHLPGPRLPAPRLGLVARLGFAGVVAAGLLGGGMVMLHRHRAAALSTASPAAALAAPKRAAPDAIGAVLGGGKAAPGETTGSLPPAEAQVATGSVSGLPLPRFVSLKADHVNVHQGPTRDHAVSFIYQRAGLPVEVTAEFENWRRIRDAEGAEGWVLQSLVSGRRTALVSPWSKTASLPLFRQADGHSAVVATLQPGVQATIKTCAAGWCRLDGTGFSGWMQEDRLWGAYPGEAVE